MSVFGLGIIIYLFFGLALASKSYIWKNNWRVNYIKQGDNGPPLLLVPGFGAGTFHYDRNIPELAKNYQVYSIDLLGQGKSWPDGIVTPEQQLCYSIELWRDQILYFIENIIQEPTHLTGNSLGGFLSIASATHRPDLISSLLLLNPAPFWAFNKPKSATSSPYIWDGTLPAPEWIYKFGSSYFDLLRNEFTIKKMLETVYSNENAIDSNLVKNIQDSASNIGGHEAFTSILFSPKYYQSFEDMLSSLTCPTCLIYGKDDPWIVPYWGQCAKRLLPKSPYFEISPTGHCPHHESPNAVNAIIHAWIQTMQLQHKLPLQSKDENMQSLEAIDIYSMLKLVQGSYKEHNITDVTVELVDGKPRTIFEKLGGLLHKNYIESNYSV